ncbi:MAG TPA: hypothetical protein VEC17_02980 [Candidatus Binatia bacterium]|nr:hypothetical protein [Candidatus Binatia bacterium]
MNLEGWITEEDLDKYWKAQRSGTKEVEIRLDRINSSPSMTSVVRVFIPVAEIIGKVKDGNSSWALKLNPSIRP